MSEPLWSPSPERVAAANLTPFREQAAQRYGRSLPDYSALYAWSIEHPREFWPAVWSFCEVVSQRKWDAVLEHEERMPGAVWFRGAELNFAENLLRWRDDRTALVFDNELGQRIDLTHRELYDEVRRFASALRAVGVTRGDRVAGMLPNMPEAVIAMLATASIGAVWSSCSPDFGISGVMDRFGQIEPKVLIAADGYPYGGKRFDVLDRVAQVSQQISSLAQVVIVDYLAEEPRIDGIRAGVHWRDFLQNEDPDPLVFEPLPFDHPLYVMYSSGTTGIPKCIVHGAGGTLLQHLKELVLHTNLRQGSRIFYFTTCGWMMWNWLVSSLAVGATVVQYDGSPFHPDGNALFDLAAREGIDTLGTSPRFLAAVEKADLEPARSHDLSALETILSTGSPLVTANYDFVYRAIKRDVCLSSITGGTDLISCFALGNPIAPVYSGEIQTRGLGMKVEVFDDDARPVANQKGELVCTAPFPSMPVRFWNDDTGEKYRAAYFERFPGVWCHGDFAELTEHGGMIVYGRSDATLNPGGVRIGTAEIYRQVEQHAEVLESIVVGQECDGDTRVVLFVKLRPGHALDDELTARIKQGIRQGASPRHVPAKIVQVEDIPRTISGKIVELAVRDVIHGRPVKNTDALANPESLEHFRDRPELRT